MGIYRDWKTFWGDLGVGTRSALMAFQAFKSLISSLLVWPGPYRPTNRIVSYKIPIRCCSVKKKRRGCLR
jgi:hypothetical protein